MVERLYKVPVITNDYLFLFKFAMETDADFIEIVEYNDVPDNFNICYEDRERAAESQMILESIVGG